MRPTWPPRRYRFRARPADVLNNVFLVLVAVICFLPFVHVLAVSFSSGAKARGGVVTFWPIGFTTSAYRHVLQTTGFVRALVVSLRRTLLGTALNMVLTVLTAYPLSRPAGAFRGRRVFMWVVVFALLFDGGLIPWFLVIRSLGMLNTFWALIVPGALPIWNVILMTNFFREVPREVEEAAVIDGASHWRVLFSVDLPMLTGALAVLTLYSAVDHWNAWFDGLILMTDVTKFPLQTLLRGFLGGSSSPITAAQITVATLPVILLYPLLQRYFLGRLTLGALRA